MDEYNKLLIMRAATFEWLARCCPHIITDCVSDTFGIMPICYDFDNCDDCWHAAACDYLTLEGIRSILHW